MSPKKGSTEPPRFCSLKQAVYWIAFAIDPVPEKHLAALQRPDISDQVASVNSLVLALRQGVLTAYGVPTQRGLELEGWEYLSHRCGPCCPVTVAPVSAGEWTFKSIDIEENLVSLDFELVEADEPGYFEPKNSEFSDAYSFDPVESYYRHIHVYVEELKQVFPPKTKSDRRGAPAKFPWSDLYLHLFGKLWGEGWDLNEKRRLLIEALDWTAAAWGDDGPSDRQVRTKVDELFQHLKKSEKPDPKPRP